jgi:hypothetical protein
MIDKIKAGALFVLSLLLAIMTAGYYKTKAQKEAEARKRSETDAAVAQQIAMEREAYQKKLSEVNNDSVNIDLFTRDPRN